MVADLLKYTSFFDGFVIKWGRTLFFFMTFSFFTSRNERILRVYRKRVIEINALEQKMRKLSDIQLREQTLFLRKKLKTSNSVASILSEAFATVREASRRVSGMRHYDVQLMGGMSLVEGKISEMRTGEGKTLVATLAAYTLALWGQGVHVVTVNPYLAERDSQLVAPLLEFLGLSVKHIAPEHNQDQKRDAYNADITYGTNSEFGFDFLRDNLVQDVSEKVQRGHFASIIDEVDSVLIDEARTPLIISGLSSDDASLLPVAYKLAHILKRQAEIDGSGDVYIDEKEKRCTLSEAGLIRVEDCLHEWGILEDESHRYQHQHLVVMGMLDAALRAQHLYFRDVDYLVDDDEIKIIDAFTGRVQEGRRWSDGLHQALEVKEGVELQGESITLSSITYQNYFRMYKNLSGMTGTADTEAHEFFEIYKLETLVIPTNEPLRRKDELDAVYATSLEKMQAVVADIIQSNGTGQPVLVGTTSVEQSELISKMLLEKGIFHEILNAKNHAREALIIAQAGRKGAVTIATNMAGRGTDILLGGNPLVLGKEHNDLYLKERSEVLASGGLRVIGTERHESRRVDHQLRGRSGRQGDPGASKFYLSLDDGLLRIFGGDRLLGMVKKLGLEPGEAIASPWLSRSIEGAQKKVENQHYEVRKQLLEYDDVANAQRVAFYRQRDEVLKGVLDHWLTIRKDALMSLVSDEIPDGSLFEEWNLSQFEKNLRENWDIVVDLQEAQDLDPSDIMARVLQTADDIYGRHVGALPETVQEQMISSTVLKTMDDWWQRHLTELDRLREGIHLRSYAQQDPKQIYKKEAFEMFKHMVEGLRVDTARTLQLARVLFEMPSDENTEDANFSKAY